MTVFSYPQLREKKTSLFSDFLFIEYPGNKLLKIKQTKLDNLPPSSSELQKDVTMVTCSLKKTISCTFQDLGLSKSIHP